MKIKYSHLILGFAFLLSIPTLSAQKYKTETKTDDHGYRYETVTNDPTHTRVYTLKNGLTVYLSRNTDEPRIETFIPVRTGSANDPADNTGLAHYLEHMMFKGTSKMGALNWNKEKVELQKISDLYEKHKATKDPALRKQLYHQIDSISQIAAKYVAANEYDRLTTSIGAQGTNAHTWLEETVYKNNIPSNQLERWLQIESERFDELVLRLFHTELEAVYEEFNMGQDNVNREVNKEMMESLFPTTPFGTQTTIGTSEHLKSPSMVAIHKYWDKYYVPNNYAIVLVGDLDYDKTIQLVDKYFGSKKAKDVKQISWPTEKPITKPVEKTVYSKDAEFFMMAYRLNGGADTKTALLAKMMQGILSNGKAGLIDLDINLTQKARALGCYDMSINNYTIFQFYGFPKDGQTLEEVRDLALQEIEKVKKGQFPDWLMEAIINNMELEQTQGILNITNVATAMYETYIAHRPWSHKVAELDELRKITKKEIMEFAQKNFNNNYVIVFKKLGENKDLIRVENPGITPLEIDRNAVSDFGKKILEEKTPEIKPMFVDFKKDIKTGKVKGTDFQYIINKDNDLFYISYIFDMGTNNNKLLNLASDYIDYLGTKDMTPEQINQEFFKLGLNWNINVGSDRTTITITGIKKSMAKGIALVENILNNVQPNQEALNTMVAQIIKSRTDRLTDKNAIFGALNTYAKYGDHSSLRDEMNNEQLKSLKAEDLIKVINDLCNYKQKIFYYGNEVKAAKQAIAKNHRLGTKDYPTAVKYEQIPTGGKVYYATYDMVQAQMSMIRRVNKYDPKLAAASRLFNAYFGGGMSSIVFQDIRELKSLAYSAYAYYGGARKKGDYQYVVTFIGTQVNKLPEAFAAMEALVTNMPEAEKSFETAKISVLKDIEAERINRDNIFWTWESYQRLGIDYNLEKQVYDEVQKMTLKDLVMFFNKEIKGNNYTYVLIGNEKDLPLDYMKKYGEVKKLTPNFLFNEK